MISLCRTKPVTEAPSAWLAAALGKEDKSRRWPTDSEFEQRWVLAPMYGSRACPIILECLEEQSGHHEAVQLDQATVEHIMPQTLTPAWEGFLGPDQESQHAEWLHTIGNLTLTGYNPELGNKSYAEKRAVYALSHFELNRYFCTCETWGPADIQSRATGLFKTAIQVWPRPPITIAPDTEYLDEAPAAFHAECIEIVKQQLGVHLSKLSQTRYESGDGQIRLVCAVSTEHNESGGVPYYWFAFHRTQLDFLETAPKPLLCFGCGSATKTLLLPLSVVRDRNCTRPCFCGSSSILTDFSGQISRNSLTYGG